MPAQWLLTGSDGQLGTGFTTRALAPTLVTGDSEDVSVTQVVAGGFLCVTSSGFVFAFGDGSSNRLGVGDDECRLMPTRVQGVRGVVQAAAGAEHSVCVTTAGSVLAWGAGGVHLPPSRFSVCTSLNK